QLSELGVDYRATRFTPESVAEVIASLDTRADTSAGEELIVCESGPHLGFRLLESYPGAGLQLSVSPRYIHTATSPSCQLRTETEQRLIETRAEDDQVFPRYRRAGRSRPPRPAGRSRCTRRSVRARAGSIPPLRPPRRGRSSPLPR